jgi:hypothetical protein
LVNFVRKSASHLSHLAKASRMGKLCSKLLQARLRTRALGDFNSQFLIGFFCLQDTLRNSQLESVVETPQLRFVFFPVTDVQCNTEKVGRRSVFEIGLAAGRNPALDAVTDPTNAVLNVVDSITLGIGTFDDRRLDAPPVFWMYTRDKHSVIDMRFCPNQQDRPQLAAVPRFRPVAAPRSCGQSRSQPGRHRGR